MVAFRTREEITLKSLFLSLFVGSVPPYSWEPRGVLLNQAMMPMFARFSASKPSGTKLTNRGDADTLEKLWSDDMEVAVPKRPVMTKADLLKFARSGRMKFLSYKSSDVHFRVYDNAAVVTGRLQRTRNMNDKEISDDWRFTKTYVREAGQWRVVSFHACEAAQP